MAKTSTGTVTVKRSRNGTTIRATGSAAQALFDAMVKSVEQSAHPLYGIPSAPSADWPHGATVKLRYVGFQNAPNSREFGWAKRDANGHLVSAYSMTPLDENAWEVVEERRASLTNSGGQEN